MGCLERERRYRTLHILLHPANINVGQLAQNRLPRLPVFGRNSRYGSVAVAYLAEHHSGPETKILLIPGDFLISLIVLGNKFVPLLGSQRCCRPAMILMERALTRKSDVLIALIMGQSMKDLDIGKSTTRLVKPFVISTTIREYLARSNQTVSFDCIKGVLVYNFTRNHRVIKQRIPASRPPQFSKRLLLYLKSILHRPEIL